MAKRTVSRIRFETPIKMDLRNNPGPVTFDSLDDFHAWFAAERDFWKKIDSSLTTQLLTRETKHFLEETQKGRWLKMEYSFDTDGVSKLLRLYADGHLIHRDSRAGQSIDALAASGGDAEAADLIIAGNRGEISVEFPGGGEFNISPLIHAASEIAADRASATVESRQHRRMQQALIDKTAIQAQTMINRLEEQLGSADGLEKRIKSLGEDLGRKVDEALAPHLSRIDTLNKNVVSDIRKAQDSFASAIKALEERFQNAMDKAQEGAEIRILAFAEAQGDRIDIKAVADLWTNKRKWHKRLAIGFGVVFALGLVSVVVGAYNYGFNFLDAIGLTAGIVPATPSAGDTFDIARRDWNPGGIVLAAAVGLAVYAFLRQLGRLFLTNLAQYSDADERIAMIDSFLSLEKEGKLTAKEDRILILQALFRPGPGTGARAGDEGMPPHWFDMLMRRIDPGRGGKGSDV